MAVYGERILQQGLNGPDVAELQLRLAGFRGTVPDGGFGPGTELQVVKFQTDVMKLATPTGVVEGDTYRAIDAFAKRWPIDFKQLTCKCGKCGGFGNGRFKGRYMPGGEGQEMSNRYEYPGIHRMILWASRAVFHYFPDQTFSFNSGYRCSEDNLLRGRTTTNHHGKAVDLDMALKAGEGKREDRDKCDRVRGVLVEKCAAQIGWAASNRKSLEPTDIAPTWVHYDVRQYEAKYLADSYFCTTLAQLDNALPILV